MFANVAASMTGREEQSCNLLLALSSTAILDGRRGRSNRRNSPNWTDRHQVSVSKYTVLQTFVFIGKLLRYL
jgi:hypothetical protein